MDEIVNLIMGSSTTLDAYVIVRLCVLYMGLELMTAVAAALGRMKR